MADEPKRKKAPRGAYSKAAVSVFESRLKDNMLDAAVEEMRRLKSRNGGRLPKGSTVNILNELKKNPLLADATRDTLRNHMVKLQKKNAPTSDDDMTTDNDNDNSGEESVATSTFPTDESERLQRPPTPDDDSSDASLTPPTVATPPNKKRGRPKGPPIEKPPKKPKAPPAVKPPKMKPGRPKGSTKALSLAKKQACEQPQEPIKVIPRALKEARESALEWATKQLMEKQQAEHKLYKRHLKSGTLKALIDEANTKFELEGEYVIKEGTVRTRAKRGRPFGRMLSPMHDVEPYLVEWCKQRYRMGEVFDAKAFLAIANSIIVGTPTEAKVLEFKKSVKAGDSLLGIRYFHQFMKRHGGSLSAYKSLNEMYDNVYDCMEKTGIARKLDTPLLMNRRGEIVTNDSFGLPVEHELLHPERLLFLDETGYSTSKKTDGQLGGSSDIGEKGGRANISAASKDAAFTVAPMFNGLGLPVLCTVIFKTNTAIQAKWITGIDSMVPVADYTADDAAFLRNNSGPGKMFPSGPVCNIAGKRIPCYVTASPSGDVTSQVFTDVLKYLDDFDVFPRATGPPPFVVLDCHTSNLGEPLRKYTNCPAHKWTIAIGTPNTTDEIQFEYALEMNGDFKTAMASAKEELVRHKKEHYEAVLVCATDVIPLVNKAWASSFGDAGKGLTALADRGWNPMNRALLTMERASKPRGEEDAEDHGVGDFNSGAASSMVDEMFARENDDEEADRAYL
jgi:hypothetical protein